MINKLNKEVNIKNFSIVKTLVLIMCIGTLFLSVLSITGHGYIPPDDASRHVAKVISGRELADVLVLDNVNTLHGHDGWHLILDLFKRLTGVDKDGLLVFSIAFLFLLITVTPLFLFKHQEVWVATLLIFAIFNFPFIWRFLLGRPFIFTMSVMLIIFFLWDRLKDKDKPYVEIFSMTLLIFLTVWVHTGWYLFFIPLLSLLMAREWKIGLYFFVALVIGVFAGSLFYGNPFDFFSQTVNNVLKATTTYTLKNQLVTELQPFDGASQSLIVIAFVLLWIKVRNKWTSKVIDNPVFIMAILCWMGGFLSTRTWLDWGFVAILYWSSKHGDEYFKDINDLFYHPKRLVIAAFFCISFFLLISADFKGRWSFTATLAKPIHTEKNKNLFPDKGGILYSNSMGVFYRFFYDNPHLEYKFILGAEPTLMPKEDLKIYRNIQIRGITQEAFQPWIDKMTEKDRLVIISDSKPKLDGLVWENIVDNYWSGRKEK